jgi:protein O-mannosyl-transferase
MANRKKLSNKHATKARSWGFFPVALYVQLTAGAVLIAAAVFLAYGPSMTGGFILDDNRLLWENDLVKASDGLHRYWCTSEADDFWPVTNTSLWIEWRLWGISPTGYHVTNLILHIIESLLIWIILRKLSIPGSFLAALIFAVHPVNVESVAWIAQRKNTMTMLFFLLSILWYLRFDEHARLRLAAKQLISHCPLPTANYTWYCLSLAALLLALLSKGSAVVLPVMLLGIIWWLRPLTKLDLVRIAPFFLITIILAVVNMWFQTHGTAVVIRMASFSERVWAAGGVLWFYLYKAILPIDLVFIYPQWHVEAGNPLWWLPLVAALAVTAVLWWFRASWSRPFLFAWGFFCVALVPVMGFTDVGFMKYSLIADHYQHIAIIGLIALLSAGWSVWHGKLKGTVPFSLTRKLGQSPGWAAIAVAIAMVAVLTCLTWRQNWIYSGEITLYRATLEKNPTCWLAQNNLGIALTQAGRPGDAIAHYRQALVLKSDYPEAFYNMGNAFKLMKQIPEAIKCYQQSLAQKPDFIEAHINLGLALVQAGQPKEAIQHYQQALGINSRLPDAQYNLGNAFKEMGQYPQAIEHYQKALDMQPDYTEAQNDLGALLAQTGRLPEAIENYRQALAFNPGSSETHYNMGNALIQSGRIEEAIAHYRAALALRPNYPEVHHNLGAALLRAGRPQQAIDHYKQGLRLRPNFTSICFNLALAYASVNQSSEALTAAQKALELAQSQGQTELARQIEDWSKSYRAGWTNPGIKPPSQRASPP